MCLIKGHGSIVCLINHTIPKGNGMYGVLN